MLIVIAGVVLFFVGAVATILLLDYLWRKRHYLVAWLVGALVVFASFMMAHVGVLVGLPIFWFIHRRVGVYGINRKSNSHDEITTYQTTSSFGMYDVQEFERQSSLGNRHTVRAHSRSNPTAYDVTRSNQQVKKHISYYYTVGTRWFWQPNEKATFPTGVNFRAVTRKEFGDLEKVAYLNQYHVEYSATERLKVIYKTALTLFREIDFNFIVFVFVAIFDKLFNVFKVILGFSKNKIFNRKTEANKHIFISAMSEPTVSVQQSEKIATKDVERVATMPATIQEIAPAVSIDDVTIEDVEQTVSPPIATTKSSVEMKPPKPKLSKKPKSKTKKENKSSTKQRQISYPPYEDDDPEPPKTEKETTTPPNQPQISYAPYEDDDPPPVPQPPKKYVPPVKKYEPSNPFEHLRKGKRVDHTETSSDVSYELLGNCRHDIPVEQCDKCASWGTNFSSRWDD